MSTSAVLDPPDTNADTEEPVQAAAVVSVLDRYRRYRQTYQRLYGPTRYDRRTRALTIRAHRVYAVMMPPLLEEATHTALRNRRLPIYTVGGNLIRWVFLTACPTPVDDLDRLEIEILKVPVTAVGAGVELALPTPGDPWREWMYGLPDTDELPRFAEVVEAAAASRSRRG